MRGVPEPLEDILNFYSQFERKNGLVIFEFVNPLWVLELRAIEANIAAMMVYAADFNDQHSQCGWRSITGLSTYGGCVKWRHRSRVLAVWGTRAES